MYETNVVASAIVKKYYESVKDYPTSYIIQKLLYYCQLFYILYHLDNPDKHELLFNEDITCSDGGPCINSISDIFKGFGTNEIIIPNKTLDLYIGNEDLTLANKIISEVFDYLTKDVYTNYAKLGDKVKSEDSAWYLQKVEDNNIIKKQTIKYENLLKAAKAIKQKINR